MKVVKSIFSKLIYTILFILVAYNIYNYVCINVLKQDISTINGYGVLEVISGSMEPTIDIGDLVVINTKFDELKENDIITFYDAKGSFVTHRIIGIVDGKYVTKGDNNNAEDQERITKDDVVGVYVTKVNGMGKLMAAFKSPITMFMILVIGILVCYLVSTDKEGNPIITKEEKEFEEFLKYKNDLNKKANNGNIVEEKTTDEINESSSPKKTPKIKSVTIKSPSTSTTIKKKSASTSTSTTAKKKLTNASTSTKKANVATKKTTASGTKTKTQKTSASKKTNVAVKKTTVNSTKTKKPTTTGTKNK